jgi:predicted PurR-regulated permease PerM
MKNIVRLPFYARVALTLFAIALVLLFMWAGKSVLIPLFFAFLIAILLHPLVRFFERIRFPRALASLVALLLFLVLIAGLFYFFSRQLSRLTRDLPAIQHKLSDRIQDVQDWINDKYHINNSQQADYAGKTVNGMLNAAVNSAATTFVGIAETVVLTIFIFVFTFFILFQRRLFMRFALALFDEAHNKRVSVIVSKVRLLIYNYVLGLLMEMLVLMVLIFASLKIIGIRYALFLSVIAAILNIIPYFGIYISMALAVLVTVTYASGGGVLAVIIVFLAAHFVDANVILPRIVGGQVKMNPFLTLLAVLAGHLVWGIPGMFLFVPLMAMIRLISEEIPSMKPWAILIGEDKEVT